jgi:putative endonuclease
MRRLYVYILSSKSRRLYVGVTNNLYRRVYEHVSDQSNFSSRYRVHRLVYFEWLGPPIVAIRREKRLKRLLRSRKVALIERDNPAWDDLAEGWFSGEPGEPSE